MDTLQPTARSASTVLIVLTFAHLLNRGEGFVTDSRDLTGKHATNIRGHSECGVEFGQDRCRWKDTKSHFNSEMPDNCITGSTHRVQICATWCARPNDQISRRKSHPDRQTSMMIAFPREGRPSYLTCWRDRAVRGMVGDAWRDSHVHESQECVENVETTSRAVGYWRMDTTKTPEQHNMHVPLRGEEESTRENRHIGVIS